MAQVLKIMKQCGVIERYFLAIGKFEPGIYTIVRSFSPDDSLRLPFLAAVRTVSRQSSIPLVSRASAWMPVTNTDFEKTKMVTPNVTVSCVAG
jgi:hypothetical protein